MADRTGTERFVHGLIAELWNASDLSVMPKYFTDDCVMHLAGEGTHGGRNLVGREIIREGYVSPTLRDFPGLLYEIKDLAIDADRVTLRFWGAGPVPSGQRGGEVDQTIRYEGVVIIRMVGGRMGELWVHTNLDSVLAGLAAH